VIVAFTCIGIGSCSNTDPTQYTTRRDHPTNHTDAFAPQEGPATGDDWQDGHKSVYSISLLRSMCPCAQCRVVREGGDPHDISPVPKKKPLLTILPGNYSGAITVTHAEMVGNYAIKLVFSDQHDAGIYSFEYLREIGRARGQKAEGRGQNQSKTCSDHVVIPSMQVI